MHMHARNVWFVFPAPTTPLLLTRLYACRFSGTKSSSSSSFVFRFRSGTAAAAAGGGLHGSPSAWRWALGYLEGAFKKQAGQMSSSECGINLGEGEGGGVSGASGENVRR